MVPSNSFGINYWNTYTVIVKWCTICLMFILSIVLGLIACQINYTQAFRQANLDDPVYMHMLQGWHYCMATNSFTSLTTPNI